MENREICPTCRTANSAYYMTRTDSYTDWRGQTVELWCCEHCGDDLELIASESEQG